MKYKIVARFYCGGKPPKDCSEHIDLGLELDKENFTMYGWCYSCPHCAVIDSEITKKYKIDIVNSYRKELEKALKGT